MNEAEQWWNGPPWLFDPSLWPADIVTRATDNSNAEKFSENFSRSISKQTMTLTLFSRSSACVKPWEFVHGSRGLITSLVTLPKRS